MVFINSFRSHIRTEEYQKNNSSHVRQGFNEIVQDTLQASLVYINTRDVFRSTVYDALLYIQESSNNKARVTDSSSHLHSVANFVDWLGELADDGVSPFQDYDGTPKKYFQIYVPVTVNDDQLKIFLNSLDKEEKLSNGTQVLLDITENDSAKVYNQSDVENFAKKLTSWKQSNISSAIWDRRMIDEESIQQFQQESKQIFTGAIGSIRFSIIY
ncbi:hypothetical protein X471_00305 [Bartonella bacilliformis str. Heidi Mejia]|uniref:Uncharacterized protein n=2 Tax=Bartonella bacilliformis TaxID=774 RepID=A1UST9_BARBK|nr:hypothetical protein [Bartonella bacilliformis]ABM44485.1 hypothetical protein BARBAKC583_0744 [Bartonella bacilliformis KC583]AMG85845.1 hypothetical protein AL467_03590 [Bartonella bacilliformis]EKS44116.1 hypothetical protein BbINS_03517 [Bartonella bacilliformis INS]EYS89955.1 hypothetical protein X472_00406 [Bartonella bacilliformis San Pedro600-02]EYS92020.1 hypothetical protein X471_00305 [Bartonella bacilliformis str. Heidi Mejia]